MMMNSSIFLVFCAFALYLIECLYLMVALVKILVWL